MSVAEPERGERLAGSSHSSQLSTPATAELTPSHAAFAEFHEGYVRSQIGMADTKATILIGLLSTFLAYLFHQKAFHDLVFHPAASVMSVLALGASVSLGLSAACAALVIAPRLGRSTEGLIFFQAVAGRASSENYLDDLSRRSPDQLISARIQHNYDISRVCTRKYAMLRSAIWLGFSGVAICLPTLGVI